MCERVKQYTVQTGIRFSYLIYQHHIFWLHSFLKAVLSVLALLAVFAILAVLAVKAVFAVLAVFA